MFVVIVVRLLLVLALSGLASARGDCEACISGICHSRRPILTGFSVTDQLVIDKDNNILYLQLNGNTNVAIFLDDMQQRLVNTMNTTGMAYDRHTQTLYLGTQEGKFYSYSVPSKTTTDSEFSSNIPVHPDLLQYLSINTLVFMKAHDNNTSTFCFIEIDKSSASCYDFSVDYLVSNFVIDSRQIFFISQDTLYVGDNQVYSGSYPPNPPRAILSKKQMIISSPTEDNVDIDSVYIGSATEKVIYKLNKYTQELVIHAGYKTAAVKDFVFAKNDLIVFRDADDNIAQWVPTYEKCIVQPPHDTFTVIKMTCP